MMAGQPVPHGTLKVAGQPLYVVPVVKLDADAGACAMVLFHCAPADASTWRPPEPGSSAAGLLCCAQVSCGWEHEQLCLCWWVSTHARTHTHTCARGHTHMYLYHAGRDDECCVAQNVWTVYGLQGETHHASRAPETPLSSSAVYLERQGLHYADDSDHRGYLVVRRWCKVGEADRALFDFEEGFSNEWRSPA